MKHSGVKNERKQERCDSMIFTQDCCQYLRHIGIEAADGDSINCPYRPTSDSGAFVVNGPVYYDHARGEGGNVWQLALKMNGDDKRRALESLHESAGVPFVPSSRVEETLSQREQAQLALKRVYDAFKIDASRTPSEVIDYLERRMVSEKTLHYFGYIPEGCLRTVLNEDEIALTGLKEREGLIILWYFLSGMPVYYCTRDIETKAFKKAYRENQILSHPIWNHDSLYRDQHVVWGEGMFDCTSLMEIGFGVAGEITCNLIGDHKPILLKALRWRTKYHPDWTFTICLDNDGPTATEKRPGNEAAEKLALWLWSNGVDVRWVKHDPTAEKVDINLLHQNKLVGQIRKMIEESKYISEILAHDEEVCLRNIVRMMSHQDYRGTSRLLSIMEQQKENATIKDIIRLTHDIPWKWQDIYNDAVKNVFTCGGDIYVVFEKDHFGVNQKHYEVFKSVDFCRNMKRFQNNPLQQVALSDLDMKFRRPTWRVSKGDQPSDDVYNLFAPSPLLLQTPKEGVRLPPMWERVLDNLADSREKEWLLNHMAVYVQTLKKPHTILVFVGRQGTGKTVLAKLLGRGIGGFVSVDNTLVESQFNGYLMNPVVLLDELANSQRDSNQLKNRLKQLINETQSINAKHRNPFSAELNNYVIIASNEQTSHVPLVIEDCDRRYCIISGGNDQDLAHESWFDYEALEKQLPDFMLYLLSRPIDVRSASVPLMTVKKAQLTLQGEDYKVACVREYVESLRAEIDEPMTVKVAVLCDQINEKFKPQYKYISRVLGPILESMGLALAKEHNQNVVTIHPFATSETPPPPSTGSRYTSTLGTTASEIEAGKQTETSTESPLDGADLWGDNEGPL